MNRRSEIAEWSRLGLLVRRLASRAVSEFFADWCPDLEASIAFRVLFAVFPLAIVVAAVFDPTSAAVGFKRTSSTRW